MSAQIERVDHPVIGVHNLDEARSQYERLGFTVPPVGRHQEWGTANLCIMFKDDYLEIRGTLDSSLYLAGLDEFLEHGEGLMGVAINTRSAVASHAAARAAGLDVTEPRDLHRRLVLADRTLDLRFRNVMLRNEDVPGLSHANLCEHLTPDLLRQPGWMDHPNGAISIGKITGVVSSLDEAEAAYSVLLGPDIISRNSTGLWMTFSGGSSIELILAEEATRRGDAQSARGRNYIAAATVTVRSLAVLETMLMSNGITYRRVANAIASAPEFACGARLYFVES